MLIGRLGLYILEYSESGGSLQRFCSRQQFGWPQNISIVLQFISKMSYFSFIALNLTVKKKKDQLLSEACFFEQTEH